MKKIFEDCDKVLLISTIVLCLFGLFNIVTVSSQEASSSNIYFYFFRQLIFVVAGVFLTAVIMTRPIKNLYKYLLILFGGCVFFNIYAILSGAVTRGASNWVNLGPISFQPSELSKPVIILTTAFLFERFAKIFKNPRIDHTKHFVIIFTVGLLIPMLVFLQKDIGTFTILTGTFLMMFIFSPISNKEKLKMGKIVGVLALVLVLVYVLVKGTLLTDAQRSRLDYFDPCSSEKFSGSGFQVCNAFIAINRGGLTGAGIGNSTQKYSYIPEPHTDMVFAIISEEYGFVVGVVILLIYALMIVRILNLATYATSISGRFICIGVATYMFLHIFINLGGLFAVIPLTGVPLPFLSYGGSFLVSLLVALALVQRVHIDTKRTKVF